MIPRRYEYADMEALVPFSLNSDRNFQWEGGDSGRPRTHHREMIVDSIPATGSVGMPNHRSVEVLEGYPAVGIAIGLLQHQLQRLIIQLLLHMSVDVLHVFQIDVSLARSIILPKDHSNFLACFVLPGLHLHGVHEIPEAEATRLLHIKFCHDFIYSLLTGIETVLLQKQFDIVG